MSSLRELLDSLVINCHNHTAKGDSNDFILREIETTLAALQTAVLAAAPEKFRNSAMTTTETNNYGAGYNHALEAYTKALQQLFESEGL